MKHAASLNANQSLVTQWTFRLPPLGEMDGGWLYHSDNPECPVESFTLKQSLVPKRPGEVVITMTVIPADQLPDPRDAGHGGMPIASEEHMRLHPVVTREIEVGNAAKGQTAESEERLRYVAN